MRTAPNEADYTHAIEQHKAGRTLVDIAKELGTTPAALSQALLRRGFSSLRDRHRMRDRCRISVLVLPGLRERINQRAKALGVGQNRLVEQVLEGYFAALTK